MIHCPKNIWSSKGEVDVPSEGIDISQFASNSTKEEWADTGHQLLRKKLYRHARQAYDTAGLYHEARIAEAQYLREQSELLPQVKPTDVKIRSKAFGDAACAFLRVASEPGSQNSCYFHAAAECFLEVPDEHQAAKAYQSASEYTLAAQSFRKAGSFSKAIGVLRDHKNEVSPDVAGPILYASRLYFAKDLQST